MSCESCELPGSMTHFQLTQVFLRAARDIEPFEELTQFYCDSDSDCHSTANQSEIHWPSEQNMLFNAFHIQSDKNMVFRCFQGCSVAGKVLECCSIFFVGTFESDPFLVIFAGPLAGHP